MRTVLVAVLVLCRLICTRATAEEAIDYLRDIQPVLEARCYACHGVLQQKAGLRLDTVAFMREGGHTGPVVEPGSVAESYLVDVLKGEVGFQMPPEGEPLSATQIEALERWIAAGAPPPEDDRPQTDPKDHWAFRAVERPEIPTLRDQGWVRNPIDAFLAAGHEKARLTPVPEADPSLLLRRVSLDLTGLAPTRGELHAFLADDRPDAYERVVERLLDSPRFGERWGRHWMDVWRYSDWDGYGQEVRESQPHIWRWRDWIVESLNADVGYDRIIQEMLAGDELAPDDPETLRATGYLVRNWYKFNRNVWLDYTVEHTSKAFLGLTMNCARCHDHKYDPITQADYYRLRAVFEPHEIATDRRPGQADTTQDGLVRVYDAYADRPTYLFHRGDEKSPVESKPLAAGLPDIFAADLAIEPVNLPPTSYYPGLRAYIRQETLTAAEAAVDAARSELATAREAQAEDCTEREPSTDPVVTPSDVAERRLKAALADLDAIEARLRADEARYAPDQDASRVEILTLRAGLAERRAILAHAQASRVRAALELAEAKAALKPDDEATAKAVEKAEAKHAEAEKAVAEATGALDGSLPESYAPLTPVRPATSTGRRLALARWITDRANPLSARVAVNQVWMRHFGAPLVDTVFDFGLNSTPPTHPELLDWLAAELMDHSWSLKHLHRLIVTSTAYRMQSSASRDHPGVEIDPQNRFLWRMNPRRMESELVRDNVLHVAGSLDLTMGGPDLDPATGLTTPRRSLYFRHAKEKRVTFLKLFDSANVNACYRRDVSVVPQQALALANSPLTLAQARLLAKTLIDERETDGEIDRAAWFVATAFEQILGRAPTADEKSVCLEYLHEQGERLAAPDQLTPFGDGPESLVAPSSDPLQRARENLVHVLMNHTDFVTIR